jgi:Flp pilus assembly protein TadB
MYRNSSVFVRFGNAGRRMAGMGRGGAWWLFMTPGLGLILFALAILIWPELLAYMVASALLMVGLFLVSWAWGMRRVERTMRQQNRDSVYDPQNETWRVQV